MITTSKNEIQINGEVHVVSKWIDRQLEQFESRIHGITGHGDLVMPSGRISLKLIWMDANSVIQEHYEEDMDRYQYMELEELFNV